MKLSSSPWPEGEYPRSSPKGVMGNYLLNKVKIESPHFPLSFKLHYE